MIIDNDRMFMTLCVRMMDDVRVCCSEMCVLCSSGLSIHTFHGNFFVRSTDLLSLPNVNPDAGFAVQMSIEENLLDLQTVSFQAALLYTSSKGARCSSGQLTAVM